MVSNRQKMVCDISPDFVSRGQYHHRTHHATEDTMPLINGMFFIFVALIVLAFVI